MLHGGGRWRLLAVVATCVISVSAFALAGLPARATTLGTGTLQSVQMPLNVNGKHVFWPSAVNAGTDSVGPSSANNLIYHGGAVETTPRVYVVFWGSEWDAGSSAYTIPVTDPVTGANYTLGDLKSYITSFFGSIGQSATVPSTVQPGTGPGTTAAGWNNIQTQYCQGGSIGDVTCSPGSASITNPSNVLSGTWTDDSTADEPPAVIDTLGLAENLNVALDPVASEAQRRLPFRGDQRLQRDVLRIRAARTGGDRQLSRALLLRVPHRDPAL